MREFAGSFLVLMILGFTVSYGATRQDTSLIVTGTVADVKLKKIRTSRDSKEESFFQVSLRLQYHNRSDETIIVPTSETLHYGKRQLLFLELPSLDSKVSGSADFSSLFLMNSDSRSRLIEKLQETEPSVRYFAIIPPGSSYETGDTLYLSSGWRLETRSKGNDSHRNDEFVVPEHRYFKLDYSLSLKDRPEATELLLDARRRWSQFGKLLLTSNGDFLIRSEVIINKPAN
jgi:hypothetical protein